MGVFNLFKAVAGKKMDTAKETFTKGNKEPVDTQLPLQIHLGSSLALDTTPFLIHGEAITQPRPGAESVVVGYGRIDLDGSVAHRFYLESTDDPEAKSMLQMVEGDGIEECRLFACLGEVYPESEEEWAFWIGDEDGYIGLPAFEDKKGNLYDRAWGDGEGRMDPNEFSETLFLDRFGDKTVSLDHAAMLYGRWIDEASEMAEYILVSREENTDGSALVRISTGIDVIPESISVKY
ncbi:DUF2491 family protein [Desulfoluna butyratoxydans]|uniref:DUF2491 family protein n=1 Tax=Desulfoluna butyratoxydans TaxID=231438 RepID=A0A4V6ILP1_9BACT|nr:DUF2491 family protein [Desulfoluna butyratoxydans]VFQ45688.1 protein of unknown function duf2491 [Desulfoluna butyratoxydans]